MHIEMILNQHVKSILVILSPLKYLSHYKTALLLEDSGNRLCIIVLHGDYFYLTLNRNRENQYNKIIIMHNFPLVTLQTPVTWWSV